MKEFLFILLLLPFISKGQITNITGSYQNILSTATSTSIGSGDSVYMKSNGRLTAISRANFTSTLGTFELLSNKSTTTTLGTSDVLYPSQNAVKVYVDNTAASQTPKSPVDYATAAALAANTYNNGAGTITMNATGTVTIDGHVTALNENILIKDEGAQSHNGIYTVTTAGAVGVAGVFTRRTDFDAASEIVKGAFCLVINGPANASKVFTQNNAVTTLGIDPITFVQTGGAATTTFAAITGNATDNSSLNTALNLRLLASSNLSDVGSASTSRTNLGATTVGGNIFTLVNPSAIRFIKINADNSVTARTSSEMLSDIGAQASGSYALSGANTDITSVLLNQTGLVVKGATSVALTIKPNETYTTGRVLNLILNDADRTINLSGNLTVSATATVSGTNTGDQTSVSGNAGTATALATAHTINGVAFDGTSDIAITNATSWTLSSFLNEAKGADIASASTTDIGAATGNYVDVTGTVTITALGTVQAGTRRFVRFTGALTLTHNATSLILPGGVNITTVAGDVAEFISLGSGNWRCVNYTQTTVTGTGGSVLASSPTITTPSFTTGFKIGGAAASGKIPIGDGTNYVASTPTYPNTASTSGKILQSDGTNLVMSTPTFPSTAGTSGKILVSDGTNIISSTPTFPNTSATSGKMIKSDGTNWVASTETYAAPGTSGNHLVSDGTNWTAVNERTNWTSFVVSGSNATTTGQTLVDITGLTSGTLTNATLYEVEAFLNVTTSAVTTGTQYAVFANGSGGAAIYNAWVTGTTTTNATTSVTQSSATQQGTFLTTSSASGFIYIHGWITTRGSGTATISIQHLKVTSGTSTVLIGSWFRYRLAN